MNTRSRSKVLAFLGTLFGVIGTNLAYPVLLLLLTLQSEARRVRSWSHPDRVLRERPYQGQPVLLLALFEKGVLRPDIEQFVAAAKAKGLYVIAVNTLRLQRPEIYEDNIDCYIERDNFGRDFGSYRAGFMHFFSRGWQKSCPRLLMANDSVFYTRERLPGFLDEMLASDLEVLGSTENFEVSHHLGSFCIAIGAPVLRHRLFHRYWRRYRLTDVRPVVIRRGEKDLSKALKRCVSSPAAFGVAYGVFRFLTELERDEQLTDFVLKNARASTRRSWKQLSVRTVIEKLRERYLIETVDLYDLPGGAELTGVDPREKLFVNAFDDMAELIGRHLVNSDRLDRDVLRAVLVEHMVETFMSHSQIHQNAPILLRMGLPFVKLDGLYRGMFTVQDIRNIARLLAHDEGDALTRLLLERPDGSENYVGWKRAAFIRGLI